MSKAQIAVGLLFIWSCYAGCLVAGVLGFERRHYWLIGLSVVLGLMGGISNAIGPPWEWAQVAAK